MKRKTQSLNLLASLTLASLLLGFCITIPLLVSPRPLPVPTRASLPPPTTTPAPTAISAATVSILLLGVDSLTSYHPELESVWVISFIPGTSTYYFVGFSPDSIAIYSPTEEPGSLRQVYELDARMARGNEFMRDALHNLVPGMELPQAEVIYDRSIFCKAIGTLGGITLDGRSQSGQDVLDMRDALPPDPQIRLEFEEGVLRATLDAIRIHQWTPANVLAYFDLGQVWVPDYETVVKFSLSAPTTPEIILIQLAPLKGEEVP